MLRALAPLLLRCPSCDGPPAAPTLPWCEPCLGSLVACPPICSHCAGIGCLPDSCARPWRPFAPELPHPPLIQARFLLVGPGYRVLRRWKVRPGALTERSLLRASPEAPRLAGTSGGPAATAIDGRVATAPWLVPVPQRLTRIRSLGHHPALRVAQLLARERGLRISPWLLERDPRAASGPRQGSLSRRERLARELRYRLRPGGRAPRHAIVVDDFLTTGRTARAAARALVEAGTERVDFAFLGLRPERTQRDSWSPPPIPLTPP